MWNMVKDAPNYVLMVVVGLAHTPGEIIDSSDVPIFAVVLSTPDSLQSTSNH